MPALEELFLHQSIEWLQIPFRTLNDPIRHGLRRKVQAITGEFPFLTRQGHAIDILCVPDACHQEWCCHTAFKKGKRLFRFKGGKVLLILAGTLLSFIGRRMDFLHFCIRRIRICFLLCLVKKAQLGISIRVFFAGCAKLFPLRKGHKVREHCVQEFQFLCFFLQGPVALSPVSDTAPTWFSLR